MKVTWKIKSTNDTLEIDVVLFLMSLVGARPPWDRGAVYSSSRYGFTFGKMREYWEELGKRETAVQMLAANGSKKPFLRGMTTEELIQKAFSVEAGASQGAVLFNISMDGYARLGQSGVIPASVLEEDFIFIRCDSREQARRITDKIPSSQAWVVSLDRGSIFHQNY